MRLNKYGIRGLKGVQLKRGFIYFWTPPISLQKRKIFRFTTLGSNFAAAVAKARELNSRLDAYRLSVNDIKPILRVIVPMTVGHLFRQFEASPRFERYAPRTRQDYSNIYRRIETRMGGDRRMLGETLISDVSRQLAYSIYEQNVLMHGHDSANKAISACQAAFRYAMLKVTGITFNPFSELDKFTTRPRRQRWTDQQLSNFINKAEEMGYPSVGRCALLCMELMQRPGDVLSLKWGAYRPREKVWHIQQSKRGAVVRVPETHRLRRALAAAKQAVSKRSAEEFGEVLVCSTVTGKRWHRRNFTKTARRIARVAGLPDELQIRDLRRTAATEAASAGATPAELMAVGGWVNQTSIRPYLVQTLEQAKSVQAKRDTYRRLYPPTGHARIYKI